MQKTGPPIAIISDNVKSEVGSTWTKIMQDHMIKTETSEPHRGSKHALWTHTHALKRASQNSGQETDLWMIEQMSWSEIK